MHQRRQIRYPTERKAAEGCEPSRIRCGLAAIEVSQETCFRRNCAVVGGFRSGEKGGPMSSRIFRALRTVVAVSMLAAGSFLATVPTQAQLVPGTGRKIQEVGDDFEDPEWEYIYHLPKSTENLNGFDGGIGGVSKNERWYEGAKRGQPDHIRRVPTPPGGLPGSRGSLLLMSMNTGIPGRPSYQVQQDDFICDVNYRLGGSIPVERSPSFVVRVYMPPVAKWERRSGPTFAIRAAVETTVHKSEGLGIFARSVTKSETYWPGLFIEFEPKEAHQRSYDTAYFRIRADEYGGDYRGPQITQTGWWTIGMSFTPDGRVHYYAKPGVEKLTAADRIASHYPYGYRCEYFSTFFFNVCSPDDGRTWSTPWIIDDCEVFYVPGR
ncbi:MAG: hypothetical protein KatS3mg110_3945 [Pirellulaceae bacterium]|nr:MAG: hypothetical protein KatS3mg110_3945 [Pirellulaceae bacterium]